MDRLLNIGLFSGTYNDVDDVQVASTTATTYLVDGLEATKTADREIWVNGELTYTIVVSNNSGLDYVAVTLTDTLDTTLIDLVPDSVLVDGVVTAYTYASGVLTVDIGDVSDTETRTIIFKVVRV